VLPASILLVILGHLDSPSGLFWVGLVLNFLITGSFGAGLGYNTELFPTQIRGTAVGVAFTFGGAALLALSFFLLVPMFLFVARETTRKELADFVGQRT
jgi:riboflavin transporter FmnP